MNSIFSMKSARTLLLAALFTTPVLAGGPAG